MARASNRSKRIYLLDELRGLAVLCMVIYHSFYTMQLFSWRIGENLYNFFAPAQPFFACLFIFISGISSRLSHSNYKRGLRLLCVAVAISIVTVKIMPLIGIYGCEIYFGIIHLLSIAILLFALIKPIIDKIPAFCGLILFLLIFFFTYYIEYGYLGLGIIHIDLPESLYQTSYLFPLGFPHDSFDSADYFPILPWIFMFLSGTFAGKWACQGKFPSFFYRPCIIPLQWFGRRALIIYILHQPVIYFVFWLYDYIIKLF